MVTRIQYSICEKSYKMEHKEISRFRRKTYHREVKNMYQFVTQPFKIYTGLIYHRYRQGNTVIGKRYNRLDNRTCLV